MDSKTELVSIKDLNLGDRLFVEWPSDRKRPEGWNIPEIVTVRRVDVRKRQVDINETGGLCLEAEEFHRIITAPLPEPEEKPQQQLSMF